MRLHKKIAVLIGVLGISLIVTPASAEDDCHPKVEEDHAQFVVGYGSLMEEASKKRTSPDTGINHPVLVRGFKRAWNAAGSGPGVTTTYLGVDAPKTPEQRKLAGESADDPEMYAAVYHDKSDGGIKATDKRESVYCRYAVAPGQIELLDGWALPTPSQVWIYALPPDGTADIPTAEKPIVQSYVDIFLTGCIALADQVNSQMHPNLDFAVQCIETTDSWNRHWVNDRLYPRRAFIYQPNAGSIDKLLFKAAKTKDLYGKVKIE